MPLIGPIPVEDSALHVVTERVLRSWGFRGDGRSHPLSQQPGISSLSDARERFGDWVRSVDEESDGVALQKVIIEAAAQGANRRDTWRRVSVELPPCYALASRTLIAAPTTDIVLSVRGCGMNNSVLELLRPDAVFLRFGSDVDSERATGRLLLTDLRLVGKGGTAVSIVIGRGSYSLQMDHVQSDGFGTVVNGKNLTGCTFNRVIAGCNEDGLRLTNAFKLTATHGCYQNFFNDCQLVGFRWGFHYLLDSEETFEGQVFRGVNVQGANGFLLVERGPDSKGSPPLWVITECEWECWDTWIDIDGVSDLFVKNCYAQGLHPDAPALFPDLIRLNRVENAWLCDNSFVTFHGRYHRYIHVENGNTNIRVIGNKLGCLSSDNLPAPIGQEPGSWIAIGENNDGVYEGENLFLVGSNTPAPLSPRRVYRDPGMHGYTNSQEGGDWGRPWGQQR